MLEAFYRAIKAVNQSLLNDLWFLTCFIGSATVVAAHCTHGFALWEPTYTIHDCLDYEYTLWQGYCNATAPGWGLHVHVAEMTGGARPETWRGAEAGEIQWLLWYFSCPCIPVETHLRLFPIHTNSVLQGTYRQLMCLKAERAISQQASSLKADWHAFVSGAITNIRSAIEEIYCSKRRLFIWFSGTQTTFVLLLINVQLPENFQTVSFFF